MSAFVCQDITINRIVSHLLNGNEANISWHRRQVEELGYDFSKPYSVEKLAKDMHVLNCMAVDARYGKDAAGETSFKFQEVAAWKMAVVLKCLDCWHYQCSEGEDVPAHPLYLAMEKIRNSIAHEMATKCAEYQEASWG